MQMKKFVLAASVLTLLASIVVAFLGLDDGHTFPWGTHLVTVSAVLLLGVVAGWWLRDRQLAEDQAREEANRPD
jgi:uncharacterized membrane protein YdjX (TVP38/TMEM64 family)